MLPSYPGRPGATPSTAASRSCESAMLEEESLPALLNELSHAELLPAGRRTKGNKTGGAEMAE